QLTAGACVEAAARGEAGLVDCRCDRIGRREARFRALREHAAAVFLRRDAELLLEDALEVRGAPADRARDLRGEDAALPFELATGAHDQRGGFPPRIFGAGPAALAGAEAGARRLGGRLEEPDIPAVRRARGAGGPAEYA